ncbi:MAG TPA: hypothetical protein VK009_18430 [Chloroflexota bacterium]|nr:hypothetical protein [Chloroflexota bacterium]
MADELGLEPERAIEAAHVAQAALRPGLSKDWNVTAGTLEWDCRRTLDHMVMSSIAYSGNLARRSTVRVRPVRNGDPSATIEELLDGLETATTILAAIARSAPAGARAFHEFGLADPTGFIAMACEEILIHAHDITQGLRLDYEPPADLCRLVARRLFPWAPTNTMAWPTLLWLNGRGELAGRERMGPDWCWHCAPLTEWDGTIKKRTLA